MNILDIQLASVVRPLPGEKQFQLWIDTVLTEDTQDFEIVIRVVDEDEMTRFNERYRNKKGTTNILSFPFDAPEGVNSNLLGDLLICAPVVLTESREQGKAQEHHWAHLLIHGVLHLQGYDHIDDTEAEAMEAMEINILEKLNIENPYEERSNS